MKKLVYVINIDWYFLLHWVERAKAAIEAGYEVYVISTLSNKNSAEKIKRMGFNFIEVTFTRNGVNPFREIFSVLKLYCKLKKIGPDIVHNITVKPNIYGSIVCRLIKAPAICSVTGLGYVFSNRSYKGKLLRLIVKYLYRLSASYEHILFSFENNDDRAMLIKSGIISEKKTAFIPGAGVNVTKYSYEKEPKKKPFRLLFAARMLWDKGIKDVIDSVNILKKNGYEIELIVAGILDKGNVNCIPEETLKIWDKKGMIKWIGKNDNMPDLIRSVHAVTLPTTYGEGVPRILIEAASCGRPLVATNVPGCRDIVRQGVNGYLVKKNNSGDLVEAFKGLIENDDRRLQMGYNGREIVENEFSNRIVIGKTMELYQTIVN